jgi:SAM-dependent methyltransferase
MSEGLKSKELKSKLYNNYWHDSRDRNYTARESMTLQKNQFVKDTEDEFQIYGNRLADRMIEMYHLFSNKKIKESTVLEIGCGMGRYALPFSKQSKFYYGIDMSQKMLDEAKKYLEEVNNYELILNSGINYNIDNEVDFIFSSGVFQHIIIIDIMINYIKQSINILSENGIFMFQFMGFYTNLEGRSVQGAKITAKILNKYLKNDKSINFKINEINIDPHDPKKQIFIILQKTDSFCEKERDFETFKMIKRNFRTGVFDDLKSSDAMRSLWEENRKCELHRLTFYD